jgi:hypothetical protein
MHRSFQSVIRPKSLPLYAMRGVRVSPSISGVVIGSWEIHKT